ncbi:MAG: hypothetical protein KF749_08465 [Bacteroidetes bacterium]|nr:hypothetical protein [Bacteroidota bacterium]MCW5895962.1 hypothetical protein [Bacteroidota bacterium]
MNSSPVNIVVEPNSETYPRKLRAKERDLLEFVLPAESLGYAEYRNLLRSMLVLAEGRRGKGNLVLGNPDDVADIVSPLAPVVAYGVVETTIDRFTITVRECVGDQIDAEIVSAHGTEIPDHFEEKRRWTYSGWKPGSLSPALHSPVREVRISDTLTFVIATQEKRLWLHDAVTLMNHLIPITNFYNELMLHKGIRDPNVALNSNLLFEHAESHSDADMQAAFIAYNRLKKRVEIVLEQPKPQETGFAAFFRRIVRKNS